MCFFRVMDVILLLLLLICFVSIRSEMSTDQVYPAQFIKEISILYTSPHMNGLEILKTSMKSR